MSKKPKKFGKKDKSFSEKILKILSKEANKPFNYKQIAAKLELNDTKSRNEIIKDLKILAAQKRIIETEPGKYLVKATSQEYYEGTIDMTSRKTAYFVCEDLEHDVFIPFTNLHHALDNDKVKVYVYNRRTSRKPEAEVIEILERAKTEFVGVIDIQKNFGFVTTANAKMYTDIFIPKNKLNDAEHGDVVLVTLEDWPEKADSPFGSVTKVLGKPGEHNTEIHAILAEYGLPYDFPIEVDAFANKLDTSITPEEIAKLYKNRWKIELFFKWIKQHLRITEFWGRTENAVKTHVYIAVITYTLIAIIKQKLKTKYSTYETLQILGASLLDKTSIQDLLKKPYDQEIKEQLHNQLKIF